MDSDLEMVGSLIREGEGFTWENFCYPSSSNPGQFASDDKPEWLAWKRRVVNIVKRLSTATSPALALAMDGAGVDTDGYGRSAFSQAQNALLKSLVVLQSALQEDRYGELRTAESRNKSPALSNRVFVVHGHDSALKTDVERFVREIGLEPVVLHRQPDGGATIIEKFEKNSDVGYAFVLLTPDEVAYTVDQEPLPDAERKKEHRARPNVILELGHFIGRLGRERVCCLRKGAVAVPSDLHGVVYKEVGESVESQAYAIIRELRAVGYNIRLGENP